MRQIRISINNCFGLKDVSVLSGLHTVEVFSASGVGWFEIPSFIYDWTNLRELVLSRNHIDRVDPKVGQLRHLHQLDLRENRCTQLPDNVFSLPNLREALFDGNPLEEQTIKRLEEIFPS